MGPVPSPSPAPGPEGLNPADPGIALLARATRRSGLGPPLLVHCGEVPGISPGTRLISDVRERLAPSSHVRCTPEELEDGARFGLGLVWPRAHLGKDFTFVCLGLALRHCERGGQVLCAARKNKGGKTIAKKLEALAGEGVRVLDRDRGYHLYCVERSDAIDIDAIHELVERSYAIDDPRLEGLSLRSVPGVFSRERLDAGTAALLAVARAIADEAGAPEPRRVLDLGAGIGPLGLWAARRFSTARVLCVETNLRALRCLRDNAARHDLSHRVVAHPGDGLPAGADAADDAVVLGFRGQVDLALVNPPTHADPSALARLLAPLPTWLASTGRALFVVNRPGRVGSILSDMGATLDGGERDGYFVLSARWPS